MCFVCCARILSTGTSYVVVAVVTASHISARNTRGVTYTVHHVDTFNKWHRFSLSGNIITVNKNMPFQRNVSNTEYGHHMIQCRA